MPKVHSAREVVTVPAILATVVALLGMVAEYLTLGDADFRHSAIAAVLGGLVGGTIGILFEVAKHLRESLQRLEIVSNTANARVALLTELPISELDGGRRGHFQVVCQLIGDALRNVRVMANVNQLQYLNYLERAIEVSEVYEGIQRFPIRWFKHGDAQLYLHKLRDKKMQRKVRLFVIDDKDEEPMQQDLNDRELLNFYWEHTGPVITYWITVSELRAQGLPLVEDCGLYDGRLLIRYDEVRRVLGFEVGTGGEIAQVSTVFARVRQQEEQGVLKPFHKLALPAATRGSTSSSNSTKAKVV
jgi:hypothetical protein